MWPHPDLREPPGFAVAGDGISQALSLPFQLRTLRPGHGEVGLHRVGCWEQDGDTSSWAAGLVGQQHELDRSQGPPRHLGQSLHFSSLSGLCLTCIQGSLGS